MENIKDYRIEKGMSVSSLVRQMGSAGFQAERLARGIEIIKEMKKKEAKVFLTFTANMVASGLRSIFAKMCELRLVDVIITTGGAI